MVLFFNIKSLSVISLNNQAIKNFTIYGIGQAINILSPLIITPYLIYVCGLEKFGIISIAQSLIFILIVIVDYSSYIKGVKDISVNRENNSKLENIYLTISYSKLLLFSLVLLVFLGVIYTVPYFYNERIVFLFSLFFLFGQCINPTWFFQGVEYFGQITILNILSKVIFIAGVLLFIKKPEDYIYANFWLGLGLILSSVFSIFFILNKYKINLRNGSLLNIKKYLKKDFSFCVSQLFFATRNYSPIIIVGFVVGEYIAGQFRVVEQIINVFRTYLQMFFKFSYSYICFEVDKNTHNGIKIWKKYNGLNLIFIFFLLLLVYIFSNEILHFFKVKSNLSEMNNLLSIALFIPLLIGLTLAFEQLLFSLGKEKVYIKITMTITILNVILLAITTKYFILVGSFLTLIFTEICLIVIYWILLKKYFIKTKNLNNDK